MMLQCGSGGVLIRGSLVTTCIPGRTRETHRVHFGINGQEYVMTVKAVLDAIENQVLDTIQASLPVRPSRRPQTPIGTLNGRSIRIGTTKGFTVEPRGR